MIRAGHLNRAALLNATFSRRQERGCFEPPSQRPLPVLTAAFDLRAMRFVFKAATNPFSGRFSRAFSLRN
jgi:hypothetical protein